VLETVRNTYQDEQREIRKKQSTLNILNQIESQLKSNVKSLNFIDTELNIPDYITFTDSGWERLAAADKTAFITWAKKLRQLPTKAPLVESEWNALSTVDKKAMVDWAKDITAGSEQSAYDPNIPDKDFVLATVWLLSGVQSRDFVVEPGSTCDLDCVAKKTFSLDALWSIWIYPENYIKNWDPESDKAKEYQKKKNAARTLYNSVLNEISIPYTINQAELALKKIDATNLRMESLYYDCEKIKSIIRENDSLRTDPDGHKKMLTILKARKGELKTPEIRDSITNGASILSDPIGYYQSQPENNCNDRIGCKQDIGIVGDTDDDDNPTDPGLAQIAEYYQVQIPKNVWELVEQGPVAMCRLNRFVSDYVDYATKKYKRVECDASSNGWMTMTKKSLTSYLFTDGL
jgi:hypothetical protein